MSLSTAYCYPNSIRKTGKTFKREIRMNVDHTVHSIVFFLLIPMLWCVDINLTRFFIYFGSKFFFIVYELAWDGFLLIVVVDHNASGWCDSYLVLFVDLKCWSYLSCWLAWVISLFLWVQSMLIWASFRMLLPHSFSPHMFCIILLDLELPTQHISGTLKISRET